ncbi:MAG: O-antigen ligase family protein, partial [Bacillota bacterium]
MQNRESGKSIYFIAGVMTAVQLLSASSGSSLLALISYAFLPIGLLKPESLIPTYFIASLSSTYFVAAQGVGFTRLIALAIIAGVVIRLFVSEAPIKSKWLANCAIIAGVTFISFLFAYNSDISPIYVMGLNILVFIAMMHLSLNKDEVTALFRAILLAVFITTIYYTISFTINPYILQHGRLTIAEGINENRFGMMLAQLSAYALAYMFFTKKNLVKAVCLALGVINAYFILLSGSRSALIGITLGFVLAVLISGYVQQKFTKWAFGMIILCLAVGTVFYSVIESNPVLASRMNMDALVSSGGTGRWTKVLLEIQYIIPNHLSFGVGPSAVNETIVLAQYTGAPSSSHNFIISALTQVGIIGFV